MRTKELAVVFEREVWPATGEALQLGAHGWHSTSDAASRVVVIRLMRVFPRALPYPSRPMPGKFAADRKAKFSFWLPNFLRLYLLAEPTHVVQRSAFLSCA
jgi:hypothetical protein